ncbi:hypothetical protein UY3_04197 [Chelonia mydas]|uniref:Uncharacterized protein n=1 Tax=Chelonia mydas TaxID=8469 RepID=M7CCV5_CHEMY|nr:hypothetical protein UY3_04197 [Chelonia mydas]
MFIWALYVFVKLASEDTLVTFSKPEEEEELCEAQKLVSSTNRSQSNKRFYLTYLVPLHRLAENEYPNECEDNTIRGTLST